MSESFKQSNKDRIQELRHQVTALIDASHAETQAKATAAEQSKPKTDVANATQAVPQV